MQPVYLHYAYLTLKPRSTLDHRKCGMIWPWKYLAVYKWDLCIAYTLLYIECERALLDFYSVSTSRRLMGTYWLVTG